jgi:PBP1b-binding outer membrane lipoprotein LpoB
MKFCISLLLISLFILSCSTNSKVNGGENRSNQNISIEAQINGLDAQLIHIDAMINAARLRKNMNQTNPTDINNAMIETEIAGYEAQKANILSLKNALLMQAKH